MDPIFTRTGAYVAPTIPSEHSLPLQVVSFLQTYPLTHKTEPSELLYTKAAVAELSFE